MAGRFKIKPGASGKVNISLRASNGRTILTGQPYADKSGAENGIASVRRHAPDADLDDQAE